MRQPTVTAIPGILARAVMGTFGRVLFLLGGGLLLLSFFLMTWPSGRGPRQQAILDLALSGMALLRAMQRGE